MKTLTLIALLLLNLSVLSQNKHTALFNEADICFNGSNKKAVKALEKVVNNDLKSIQEVVNIIGIKYKGKKFKVKTNK